MIDNQPVSHALQRNALCLLISDDGLIQTQRNDAFLLVLIHRERQGGVLM